MKRLNLSLLALSLFPLCAFSFEEAPLAEESIDSLVSLEKEVSELDRTLTLEEEKNLVSLLEAEDLQVILPEQEAAVAPPQVQEQLIAESSPEESSLVAQPEAEEEELSSEPFAEAELSWEEPAISADTEKTQEPATLSVAAAKEPETTASQINLRQVFAGSPIIYSLLLSMSMGTLLICSYNWLRLRNATTVSEDLMQALRQKLGEKQYDEALKLCKEQESLFGKMIASALSTRQHGSQIMLDAMKSEGKRASLSFWQRASLLNDIAIIAPMLGLLGTVLGMFYAFYDINRSLESMSTLFDGLGISVGTTVAGLIVAIMAMILQSLSKHRLIRSLAYVENQANDTASLIDTNSQ